MPTAVEGIRRTARYRSCGLAAALSVAVVFTAAALPATAQQPAPGGYTEEQLAAFAAAWQRIDELNRKWIPQLEQAGSEAENVELRQQAMDEMKAAVREEGLTVELYNQIYDAAHQDPAVMRQVEEHRPSPQ